MSTRRTMETRSLWVQLTDEQVESRSRQLARQFLDLKKEEAELENYKEGMKSAVKAREAALNRAKGALDALASAVSQRAIQTDVDCDWHFYLGADEGGVKVLVRRDTGEAVDRRPLTLQERQLVIGEKLEEATADQLALWEEQLAKAGEAPETVDHPLDEAADAAPGDEGPTEEDS